MRKIIIILLLAVAAVYGGIKLYFWLSLTNFADALVIAARPVAQISYGGTIATLDGKLGLQAIEIRPIGYDTTITIKAITLQADNLWELYTISSTISDGRMPQQLGINVVDMAFDPGSSLWQEFISSPGLWSFANQSYDSLYCGNRNRFSGNDFSRMGVQEVSLSVHTGYHFNPGNQTISFYADAIVPEFNQFALRLDFNTGSSTLKPQLFRSQGILPFAGGKFEYTDLGWNAKVREFCAAEMQMTEPEYIAGHTDAVWQALSHQGIDAGTTLKQTYQTFLRQDSSNISLSLDMERQIKLKNLQFYAPADILYYLNPALTVNNQTVSLAEVKASEAFARENLRSYTRRTLPESKNGGYSFSTISLNKLDRQVGKMVRLKTDGRIFEGKLLTVEERLARVITKTYSGTREEIVLLHAIESVEVGKIVELNNPVDVPAD